MSRFVMEYSAEDLKRSGIYLIKNTMSGKVYVGSSVNLKKRFYEHKRQLNKGEHRNPRLQREWNKFGSNIFNFSILEFVNDESILYEREQFWINNYKAAYRQFGYNIHPLAGKTGGRRHTEEAKRKISATKRSQKIKYTAEQIEKRICKLRGKRRPKEVVQKISQSNTGKKRSKESRGRMSAAQSKINWTVTDPHGKVYKFKNLHEFCKDHGLNRMTMDCVSRGKYNNHKGWKCYRDDFPAPLNEDTTPRIKEWLIIDPDGKKQKIHNLSEFCRANNLDANLMSKVARGINSTHKGWRCYCLS